MGNSETLVTLSTQDTGQRLEKKKGQIKNGQSRDTGNIGCTGHRKNIKENPKSQSRMGNPEILVTLATQDTGQRLEKTQRQIKNGQSRDTGNIGYTRHRTKVRENKRANQEWAIHRHW